MLILSRKKEESLIINGQIEVKIIEVVNGSVKLGIVAPKNVAVHRKEVYQKIIDENSASANGVKSIQKLKRTEPKE